MVIVTQGALPGLALEHPLEVAARKPHRLRHVRIRSGSSTWFSNSRIASRIAAGRLSVVPTRPRHGHLLRGIGIADEGMLEPAATSS